MRPRRKSQEILVDQAKSLEARARKEGADSAYRGAMVKLATLNARIKDRDRLLSEYIAWLNAQLRSPAEET